LGGTCDDWDDIILLDTPTEERPRTFLTLQIFDCGIKIFGDAMEDSL